MPISPRRPFAFRLSRRRFLASALTALGAARAQSSEQAGLSLRPRARPGDLTDPYVAPPVIGRQIMVGFQGLAPGDPGVEAVYDQLTEGVIGGVIFLSRNIASKAQLTELTGYFLSAPGGFTPLLAVDQEGGRVQRAVRGFTTIPSAAAMDDQREALPEAPFVQYIDLARELAEAGLNYNFAPVVDLNLNPANPIIGSLGRSYSNDPDRVVIGARDFILAHRVHSVATSLKHFPGHGSAGQDSHKVLPDISDRWSAQELEPFARLVEGRLADSIMLGHLFHPQFCDAPGLPASLSANSVRYIRGDLNFEGVIVTDDLQMQPVEDRWDNETAARMALESGVDLLLFSNYRRNDPGIGPRVHAALSGALDRGVLSAKALNRSANRLSALVAA